MAINEAEILRQFEKQDLGSANAKIYTGVLKGLSKSIRDDFQKVINRETKSSNGDLANSIEVPYGENGLEVYADLHYKFIDDGVSGVGQFSGAVSPHRQVVSGAPYQFEDLFVPKKMMNSIRTWSGTGIEQSYAIAVNIKNYGIKPKNITDQVWNDTTIQRVSDDLSEITGLAVTVVFEKSIND
tara:strand:+ start:9987 stop:10538 length:552 start_codon:yes stop_codon:yes gene_type:complete